MNKTAYVLILAAMLLLVGNTFAAAPTITRFTPAAGPVGTLVTVTGTNLTHLTTFTFGGVNAVVVSNTAQKLVGLVMPGATTGAISITTSGGAVTSSTNFTVRPTPYPVAEQTDKILATGTTGNIPSLGVSVAISADGKTAIAGADGDQNLTGAAVIFTRTGNNWSQQGSKLVGTGAVGTAYMGNSVAISADGNTALVGGYYDNTFAGAVWVFVRKAGVWTQQGAKLVATGTIGSKPYFGSAVSISADGNTALIGASGDSAFSGASRGGAFIFTRSGTVWTQQSKVVGSGGVGTTDQGWSVSLSADGKTALIGGWFDNNQTGAGWIFTRTGNTWNQQGNKLVGAGGAGHSYQGTSVALSAGGNTAAIGGYGDNAYNGAVWIFSRTGTSWSQQGNKLTGTGGVNNPNQGKAVALSADGNTLIEGGNMDVTSGNEQGALWVFKRTGTTWRQQGNKLVGEGYQVQAQMAYSVALSANGEIALAGAPDDNHSQGAIWAFYSQALLQNPQVTSFSPATGAVGTLVTINGNYLGGYSALTIGHVAPIVLSSSYTKIVAMVMPGATTGPISITTAGGATNSSNFTVTTTPYPVTQQGNKITVSDGIGDPGLGQSVALSADGNTALLGTPGDNTGGGGARIFKRTGTAWTEAANLFGGDLQQNIAFVTEGLSVALSADGSTAVIGGPGDNNDYGAIWVFNNATGSYQQMGSKLVPFDTIGQAQFGNAVAISADGKTIVAGGSMDNNYTGACWIFANINGAWFEQAKLVGTNGISGQFNPGQGFAVAISADGHTVTESSVVDNGFIGATWVFTNTSGSWVQQGNKLVGTGASGAAMQGTALALSANGNTAVVGGFADATAGGACWIFTRTGTTWTQQGPKIAGTGSVGGDGPTGAAQGQSVSISADGNTLVEGGNLDSNGRGAFWTFTRSGSTWTQRGNKMVGTGGTNGTNYQGNSIAISADGTTTMEGGPYDNSAGGAVWVFVSGLHGRMMERNQDDKDEGESQVTSIPVNESFSVTAYPNPFANNFHLRISGQSAENIDIKIYNIYGQSVYATTLSGIENATRDFMPLLATSNLAGGVYLVQVKQGSNSSMIRMVRGE